MFIVFKKNRSLFNTELFPPQLRMVMIGISVSGKTKVIFKLLLDNYYEFDKIIFVSPSLDQI